MVSPGFFSLLLIAIVSGCTLASPECSYIFTKERSGDLNVPTSNEQNKTKEHYVHCTWTIEMEPGHKIAVVVKEIGLDVNDSLVITEYLHGQPATALNNRRFFELKPGSVIFSQYNRLKVELFAANRDNVVFDAFFEDAHCGGALTEPRGQIEVPLSIHLSSSVETCKWEIKTASSKIIKLSFSQFSLPPGSCIFQKLVVTEGGANNQRILGDFCDENPPAGSIISAENAMQIEFSKQPSFISDLMPQISKIVMNYEFVDQCNSKISGFFGSISVPLFYATFLTSTQNCQWQIEVPPLHSISLRFLKYANGPSIPGRAQVLDIYDGVTINETKLLWSSTHGVFPPMELATQTNGLRIVRRTVSDSSYKSTGISFHAVYQAQVNIGTSNGECIYIGTRRLFRCSNGHFIDCEWKCDGIADCEDAGDEAECSDGQAEELTVANFENSNPFSFAKGTLLVLLLTVVALLACLFVLSMDRTLHNGLQSSYDTRYKGQQRVPASTLPRLPAYKEMGSAIEKVSPDQNCMQTEASTSNADDHSIDYVSQNTGGVAHDANSRPNAEVYA